MFDTTGLRFFGIDEMEYLQERVRELTERAERHKVWIAILPNDAGVMELSDEAMTQYRIENPDTVN